MRYPTEGSVTVSMAPDGGVWVQVDNWDGVDWNLPWADISIDQAKALLRDLGSLIDQLEADQ